MAVTLATLSMSATACRGYQRGTLVVRSEGQARRVGCLDLTVEPWQDFATTGPVARIVFANRCDAAVTVDLGAIRAVGRTPGRRTGLRLFDPNRVVGPKRLEARSIGLERLEYVSSVKETATSVTLCLDLAGVDPAAHLDRPVIACIRMRKNDSVALGDGR